MFDFGGFASGITGIIRGLLWVYMWIVIIRVLVSWINPDPYNPIVQFLRGITDPVIDGLRRVLPRFFWSTGLDFTPLILIILIQVLMLFLENLRI
ncbi:MAG: YggT family protein [Candidatus Latescibacterota bacterium]